MTRWYLRNPAFVRYMLREGTALFVLAYALLLLAGLAALASGAQAFARFQTFLHHPLSVIGHLLVLLACIYNTYTWFKVSPKAAPPVYVGGRRLPDAAIIGGQYAAFALVSLLLLLLLAAGAGS